MAVSSQYILRTHCRRGAILVYAMVFCITAAVAIYVASSIYQARVASSSQGNYAAQRALINWSVNHATRAAKQNSLDSGQGMADNATYDPFTLRSPPQESAYISLNFSLSPSGYGVLAPPEYGANYDVYSRAAEYFSSGVSSGFWQTSGLARRQDSMSGLNAYGGPGPDNKRTFTVGDMFTIPGWRPRRHLNENLATLKPWFGSGALVGFGDEREEGVLATGQEFAALRDNPPMAIASRGDLPFDSRSFNIPGTGWIQPNGYWRWVRDRVNYNLTARDPTVAAAVGTVNETATTWAVEEPITNYQLLLLEPDASNASGWRLETAGGPGGRVEIDTSVSPGVRNSSSVNLINRGKIFVWGPVASNFSSDIRGLQTANVIGPIAAVVRGQAPTTASTTDFEWRPAKPSTTVSFGRGVGMNAAPDANNPGQFNSLTSYLSNAAVASANWNLDTGSLRDRKLEVYNAQNTRMPLNPVGASKADLTYVNSVLTVDLSALAPSGTPFYFAVPRASFTFQGVSSLWTSNPSNTGNMPFWTPPPPAWVTIFPAVNNARSITSFTTGDIATSLYSQQVPLPPYLQNVGAAPVVPVIQMALPYGPPPFGSTTPYGDDEDFGVTITRYVASRIFDRVVVDIDLKKFGLDPGIKVVEGGSNSAWGIPREIHIKAPAYQTINGSTGAPAVVVRIFGNDDAGAADLPPVKIVVDGGQPESSDNGIFPINQIHLIPDLISTASNAGNRRRFILLTTNMYSARNQPNANVYLQQRGSNVESRWYGVIIATNGLNFSVAREDTNNFYSVTPNRGATTFTAGDPNSTLAWMGTILVCNRLSVTGNYVLRIAPDDGGGIVPDGANSDNSVYRLFTPKYNAAIPTEYPVPMVVPRMVWSFE